MQNVHSHSSFSRTISLKAMEPAPAWLDHHQPGCLFGLQLFCGTLVDSDSRRMWGPEQCEGLHYTSGWSRHSIFPRITAISKCHSKLTCLVPPEAKRWYDTKGFCLRFNITVMMTGNTLHAYLNLAFVMIFLASSSVLPTRESLLIAISWSPGRSRPS